MFRHHHGDARLQVSILPRPGRWKGKRLAHAKKSALEQAELEVCYASEALDQIKSTTTLHDVEKRWSEFLTRLEKAAVKLGFACNGTKLEPWFGSIIAERRQDEVLAYLKNARDADFHGIEPITRHEPSWLGIGTRGSGGFIDRIVIDRGRIKMGPMAARNARITIAPASIQLVPVKNRGRTYPVPGPDRSLISIGDRGLAYYRSKLAEARAASLS